MRTEDQIMADARDEAPFSNHSEYDIWADRYCYECANDDASTEKFCPILTAALLGKWPTEWTRGTHAWEGKDGQKHSYQVVDTCTEFEQRRDNDPGDDQPKPPPTPAPECDGQVDLFEVIVDQAVDDIAQAGQRQAVTA